MKLKKFAAVTLAASMAAASLAGCSTKTADPAPTTAGGTTDAATEAPKAEAGKEQVLKVAALETAYGKTMWTEIAAAFEAANPGVTVELTVDKRLEDIIGPAMKSGDYPDVVHLAVGQPLGLTETLIKEKALLDISDVLTMKIPGEEKTVQEKIIPGFTDTLVTMPYGDGKTYLAPMFYGPCGLFYDANLLKQKGWEVPKTWDDMWALGDKAKAEGISLFTYPHAGYFDAFFYALLNEIGGPEFFSKAMTYTEGIWETPEANQAFDIVGKLASYTEPTTIANASTENFLKNQQLVLDNKAIFMPNGTWVTGEMSKAPRVDGFEWGFMALPAMTEGGDSYSYTFFEQMWVPAKAENPDLAKQFLAYLYSDEATEIFATKADAAAVQPVLGASQFLEGENKLFYSIYDNGAKAAMGAFATTDPVEGVSIADSLFQAVDSVVSGKKTVAEWKAGVIEASDKLRAALK